MDAKDRDSASDKFEDDNTSARNCKPPSELSQKATTSGADRIYKFQTGVLVLSSLAFKIAFACGMLLEYIAVEWKDPVAVQRRSRRGSDLGDGRRHAVRRPLLDGS